MRRDAWTDPYFPPTRAQRSPSSRGSAVLKHARVSTGFSRRAEFPAQELAWPSIAAGEHVLGFADRHGQDAGRVSGDPGPAFSGVRIGDAVFAGLAVRLRLPVYAASITTLSNVQLEHRRWKAFRERTRLVENGPVRVGRTNRRHVGLHQRRRLSRDQPPHVLITTPRESRRLITSQNRAGWPTRVGRRAYRRR